MWSDTLHTSSKKVISLLKDVGPYRDYDGFRAAAIKYLEFYQNISDSTLQNYLMHEFTDSTEVLEEVSDSIKSSLEKMQTKLRRRFLKTKSTVAGKNGLFIEPYYANHFWPDTPQTSYVEIKEFATAMEYDDQLTKLMFMVADLESVCRDDDMKELRLNWNDSLAIVSEKVLKSLNELTAYQGCDNYRLSVIEFVQYVHKMSKAEFPELIRLELIAKPNMTEKQRISELHDMVEVKNDQLFDNIRKEQLAFAKKLNYQVKF
jgi:hypothetical protein